VFLVISFSAQPAVAAEIVRGVVVAFSALMLGVAMGALGGLIGRGPRSSTGPVAPSQAPVTPSVQPPSERTPPTPYHYGPQNDYPTAPLQTPSPF
jgi:hypothetical protein